MKWHTADNRPVHTWVEESIFQMSWDGGLCDERKGGSQRPEVLPAATRGGEIPETSLLLYSSPP